MSNSDSEDELQVSLISTKELRIVNKITDIMENDLLAIMLDYIDNVGICGHHLNSINEFYLTGIKSIMRDIFEIKVSINNPRDSEIESNIINVETKFVINDVKLMSPTYTNIMTDTEELLYPSMAVTQEKTYSGKIYVDGVISATATFKNGTTETREENVSNFVIGKIPIMVKSILCNTTNLSRDALINLGEVTDDFGGYCVVRNEYSPDSVESVAFNVPKEFINIGFGKQRVRADFLSKPGDGFQNQDMFKIIYQNDGTIITQVNRDKLMEVNIPFYLLYRAIGCTTDKEIIESIVCDIDDPANSQLLKIVEKAMIVNYSTTEKYYNIYNRNDALRKIVDLVDPILFSYLDLQKFPDNYHNAINEISETIDKRLFPHIGITSETRSKKIRFMGYLIRRVLQVDLGIIPETDRDSAKIKRIHSFGVSMSKLFKQMFNRSCVVNIRKAMRKAIVANPFNNIPLLAIIRLGVSVEDFERVLAQSITNGTRSQLRIGQGGKANSTVITNRLSAQRLHRRNIPNVIDKGRVIIATSAESAKQSDRAIKVRQIHSSCIGYVCVIASPPEGEKVGVNKQFCAFSSIAPSGIAMILQNKLLDDKEVIPESNNISQVTISREKYGFIFVNGLIIGYCKDNIALATKYRKLRRQGAIDKYTTIHWDEYTGNLNFFVDIGRLTRPLTIVYNNYRDYELFGLSNPVELGSDEFIQTIGITKEDIQGIIDGKKSIMDLVDEQKIEFITPEEQQNILICTSISYLKKESNNSLVQYTHVEVPQAILGLTALTAPLGDHNQSARNTFQNTQIKQTAGYYIPNYGYRADAETFVQNRNENPLVQTVTNRFIPPNGNNLIVAMACSIGKNQEDSTVFAKGSIERGTFNCCKFDKIHIVPDPKDKICIPDITKVEGGIKTANYSKLVDGIVVPGVKLEKGDVVLGKITEIQKQSEQKKYKDTSIVYNNKEPAIVLHVIHCYSDEGVKTIKIAFQYIRNMDIGDKASSRSGQKGICADKLNNAYMIFTESGMKPDILFNPHSIPTRMTIAQLFEAKIAKACAVKGIHTDGTIFSYIDMDRWEDYLSELGFNKDGTEVMYDGSTGEQYDVDIYIGPVYYQRLLKLVADAKYVVTQGMLDATTRQPVEGKSRDGGLRIGDMEKDVFCAHGSVLSLNEKFRNHSDGCDIYICRCCGKEAIVNFKRNLFTCKECKGLADICKVKTTWTSLMFKKEMSACSVNIRTYPEPHIYYRTGTKDDIIFEKFINIDLEKLVNDGDELEEEIDD